MNVKVGGRRLSIALTVIYWVWAALHAFSIMGAATNQTFAEIGGLSAAATDVPRLLTIAQAQGTDEGLMTLALYAAGYIFLWVVYFTVRWIVRGFRQRAS